MVHGYLYGGQDNLKELAPSLSFLKPRNRLSLSDVGSSNLSDVSFLGLPCVLLLLKLVFLKGLRLLCVCERENMNMNMLYTCWDAYGSHKRVLDARELGLQVVEPFIVGSGN